MDFGTFKTSDWLMIGGSAGAVVFGFAPWTSSDGIGSLNAFDFTLTGALPWLLLATGGTIAALTAARVIVDLDHERLPIALLALFSAGAALTLIRLAIGPKVCESIGDQRFCATHDRGVGLFAMALTAVIGLVGAIVDIRSTSALPGAVQQPDAQQTTRGADIVGPTNGPGEPREPPPAQFRRTPPPPPPPPPTTPARGRPPPPLPPDAG